MSGHPASRRLRTKTSEFAEFLRGGSSQARQAQRVNFEAPGDTEATTKKKVTRIPLFGRGRNRIPFVSSPESSDIGELLNRAGSSNR